jgi:hypothetical protein
MEKQDILDFLSKNKSLLKQKYNVNRIGLFGSYASGKQTENSDIDIIVSMPSNFDNFYDLKDFLEANLKHKVDLGLEKNMRILIREKAEKEAIYV